MPLIVCATPIGNLEDVTLRVLRELAEADAVLCEDTRRTRILLERHAIVARLETFEHHREGRLVEALVERLASGERLALVSDAGLPGVNDPGARLIAAAVAGGVEVSVLPGASAVETALVASGLVGERYTFVGFVPRTGEGRARLWRESESWRWPVVAFESPNRLAATLASLAGLQPERPVAVCRELTKRFEEVRRGSAAELAAELTGPARGEITLVLGAPGPWADAGPSPEVAADAVRELVALGVPRRRAAAVVARLAGRHANDLYRASLPG